MCTAAYGDLRPCAALRKIYKDTPISHVNDSSVKLKGTVLSKDVEVPS